jgi:hypothetical protein
LDGNKGYIQDSNMGYKLGNNKGYMLDKRNAVGKLVGL